MPRFPPHSPACCSNLLLLAADSLNGTGTVTLAGTGTDLVVAIAGPRAAWPAGLAASLANEAAAWAALNDPRTLQMPLTVLLARTLGLRLGALLFGRPGRPRSTAAAAGSPTWHYHSLFVSVAQDAP